MSKFKQISFVACFSSPAGRKSLLQEYSKRISVTDLPNGNSVVTLFSSDRATDEKSIRHMLESEHGFGISVRSPIHKSIGGDLSMVFDNDPADALNPYEFKRTEDMSDEQIQEALNDPKCVTTMFYNRDPQQV